MNKILIIGGGSIGKRHLRNLLSLGEVDLAMVEVSVERRPDLAKEFNIPLYASLAEAFTDQEYNVAFICSPSVFHLQQALQCVEHGCHIFVEKPLSHNLDYVEELIKVVQGKSVITMVGSNWKFYPLFQKMKKWIDTGKIGKILSARCQFGQYLPDWHPWEDYRRGYSANKKLGGGILLDSHEFDYLTWFVGDVARLSCFANKVSNLEIDVEDVAEVILEFKNGAIGEIHLDYLQRFYQRNFEFFGELGTIVWDTNSKKAVLQTKDYPIEEYMLPVDYDINDMYVEEARHFLDSIKSQQQPITTVNDGKKVLDLIMAAKKSAAVGKAVKI